MSGIRPTSFFSSQHSRPSNNSSSASSNSSSSVRTTDETPRRRDNVVVTSSEINSIFDALNSICSQLRDIKRPLERLQKSQEELASEIKILGENQNALQEKIEQCVENDNSTDVDGRIPPEISSDVHLLHNVLAVEQQYHPDESILSKHNASVRQELEVQLLQKEKGYPLKFVKRAIVRYYETKRKMYLQSLPANEEKASQQKEENKLRSRRKRLYKSRSKVAEGDEKTSVEALNYDYISDEENGVGDNKGKWVVRPPAWRSDRANDLMKKLQVKLESKQEDRPRVARVAGMVSERGKPRLCVPWAIQNNGERLRASRNPSPLAREGSRSPSPVRSERQRSTPVVRGSSFPLARERLRRPSPVRSERQRSTTVVQRSPSPLARESSRSPSPVRSERQRSTPVVQRSPSPVRSERKRSAPVVRRSPSPLARERSRSPSPARIVDRRVTRSCSQSPAKNSRGKGRVKRKRN